MSEYEKISHSGDEWISTKDAKQIICSGPIIKLYFALYTFDEVFALFDEKNIKVTAQEFPSNIIKAVIDDKDIEKFKKILKYIIDNHNIDKIIIDDKQLSIYIISKNELTFLMEIISFVNWNFKNNPFVITSILREDTLAHKFFWDHAEDIMCHILEHNKDLLFKKNIINFTPIDHYLLGAYINDRMCDENILKKIGKEYLVKLSQNKSTNEYKREHKDNKITVPIGSTFIDILCLIINLTTSDDFKNNRISFGKAIIEIMNN